MDFFYFSDVLLLMQSDIDYNVEATKRVLFSSNKKDEINRTEGIYSNKNTCFTWDAYLRVSGSFLFPFPYQPGQGFKKNLNFRSSFG